MIQNISPQKPLQSQTIVGMIDVSCLYPETDVNLVRQTCREAVQFGYAAVFIMPAWTPLVAILLKGSKVKIGVPIGFPLGSHSTPVKVFETREAVANGADEIDMMINIGALKSKHYELVQQDIQSVVEAAEGGLVKAILETCLLTDEEKIIAAQIAETAGVDFVKTSTGFGKGGATVSDVRLLRLSVSERVLVKAAGGINSLDQVQALLQAGAVRFGIGSAKASRIATEVLKTG